jgi:hypothetical protein
MQAYQQKTEKFFVSEEKSLVGSTPEEPNKDYEFEQNILPQQK